LGTQIILIVEKKLSKSEPLYYFEFALSVKHLVLYLYQSLWMI